MQAYVTFLIKNDSYLPGALVLAYSLLKQKTKKDLICFVSEDVSEDAIKALRKVYTDIVYTEKIITKSTIETNRHDLTELFTRFNAFNLESEEVNGIKYEKIVLLDSDILPIKNYDSLFLLDAPAGILNEKKENCLEWNEEGKFIMPKDMSTWKWHKVYKECLHGELIPKEITDRVLTDPNNMGINAGLYVLNPSINFIKEMKEDLKDENIVSLIEKFSWPEMQYLTYKFSSKWHNVDIRYASFNGYPSVKEVYGIHYAGIKPWDFSNKSLKSYLKFDDFKLWQYTFIKMAEEIPSLRKNKIIKNLYKDIKSLDEKYLLNEELKEIIKGV